MVLLVALVAGSAAIRAQAPTASVIVVLDERGCPISGAQVRGLSIDDRVVFEVVSDEVGKAEIEPLANGRYRVEASAASYDRGSAWLVVESGSHARGVVRLRFRPARGSAQERSRAPGPEKVPYIEYEILYGTSRVRLPSDKTRFKYLTASLAAGDLETGMCVVSIPHDKKMGEMSVGNWIELAWGRWFHVEDPRYHVELLEICPLDREELLARMGERLAASDDGKALVFVHGYNTAFEEAAERTAQIGYDLKFKGPTFLYSWPSLGKDGVLGAAEYLAEAEKVKLAAAGFVELLEQVAAEAAAVHVIAHSMGNQLLDEAVRILVESGRTDVIEKLDQIALVAPDLDAQVFANNIAPRFRGVGRLTLYGSSEDKALQFSTGLRGRPRLGDFSSGVTVIPEMDSIDVTAVDSEVGSDHYHFDDRAVITDFFQALKGEPVFNRVGIRKAGDQSPIYYVLVP